MIYLPDTNACISPSQSLLSSRVVQRCQVLGEIVGPYAYGLRTSRTEIAHGEDTRHGVVDRLTPNAPRSP
jgi:hypothetical protein